MAKPAVANVAMMLLSSEAWVSPGQWGAVAFFAFLMACVGGLVVNRASSKPESDLTAPHAYLVEIYAVDNVGNVYGGYTNTLNFRRWAKK